METKRLLITGEFNRLEIVERLWYRKEIKENLFPKCGEMCLQPYINY